MIRFTARLVGAEGQLYPHPVLVVDYTVYSTLEYYSTMDPKTFWILTL